LSPQEVSEQDKQQLIARYDDVRYEGFHCELDEHEVLVHEIIGDREWSCCSLLNEDTFADLIDEKLDYLTSFGAPK
jgi:hypothetical protein